MDDMKEETELTSRDAGPSSVKFPLLNSSNYTVWGMKMKIALNINEVWKTNREVKTIRKINGDYLVVPIDSQGFNVASG